MKKIIFAVVMLAVGSVYALERSAAKIQGVATPACVSVSTSAWTAIPSTSTIKSGRGGMIISAPQGIAGAFNIGLTSQTIQTPGFSTSTFGIQMGAGDYIDLSISQFVFAFAVSTHTSAQDFCYQEYTLEKDR